MKKILLLALAVFAIPTLSLAATYHYVDTSGNIASVSAVSAEQALAIAANKAPHSGVALDQGILENGDSVVGAVAGTSDTNLYQYVDITGSVQFVTASSAGAALETANNKATHSGVIKVPASGTVLDSEDVSI